MNTSFAGTVIQATGIGIYLVSDIRDGTYWNYALWQSIRGGGASCKLCVIRIGAFMDALRGREVEPSRIGLRLYDLSGMRCVISGEIIPPGRGGS